MAVHEVVLVGKQGVNDMLNVFHYEDGGTPPGDWGNVATIFRGHLDDHLTIYCTPRVTWTGITHRLDMPGAVGTFVPFPTGVLTGTNITGDQIDVVAMQVRKHTGGVIRPTRGWFMQGGITADASSLNNVWEGPVLAAALAYAEDIRVLEISGPSTLTMVIKASNPLAPNTQPYSTVATFTVRVDPRTQRSRLAGKGS